MFTLFQQSEPLALFRTSPVVPSLVAPVIVLALTACIVAAPAGQAGHGPPQSTPVSPWFWMPSEQVGPVPVCVPLPLASVNHCRFIMSVVLLDLPTRQRLVVMLSDVAKLRVAWV